MSDKSPDLIQEIQNLTKDVSIADLLKLSSTLAQLAIRKQRQALANSISYLAEKFPSLGRVTITAAGALGITLRNVRIKYTSRLLLESCCADLEKAGIPFTLLYSSLDKPPSASLALPTDAYTKVEVPGFRNKSLEDASIIAVRLAAQDVRITAPSPNHDQFGDFDDFDDL